MQRKQVVDLDVLRQAVSEECVCTAILKPIDDAFKRQCFRLSRLRDLVRWFNARVVTVIAPQHDPSHRLYRFGAIRWSIWQTKLFAVEWERFLIKTFQDVATLSVATITHRQWLNYLVVPHVQQRCSGWILYRPSRGPL